MYKVKINKEVSFNSLPEEDKTLTIQELLNRLELFASVDRIIGEELSNTDYYEANIGELGSERVIFKIRTLYGMRFLQSAELYYFLRAYEDLKALNDDKFIK